MQADRKNPTTGPAKTPNRGGDRRSHPKASTATSDQPPRTRPREKHRRVDHGAITPQRSQRNLAPDEPMKENKRQSQHERRTKTPPHETETRSETRTTQQRTSQPKERPTLPREHAKQQTDRKKRSLSEHTSSEQRPQHLRNTTGAQNQEAANEGNKKANTAEEKHADQKTTATIRNRTRESRLAHGGTIPERTQRVQRATRTQQKRHNQRNQ